jgi:hypothetical protein
MSDFAERFRNHSNSHLLKIVESKGEYQPEAIEAAKNVLESRQLTEQEMQTAKAEIANEQLEKKESFKRKFRLKMK